MMGRPFDQSPPVKYLQIGMLFTTTEHLPATEGVESLVARPSLSDPLDQGSIVGGVARLSPGLTIWGQVLGTG
jgi:hypothetical protein